MFSVTRIYKERKIERNFREAETIIHELYKELRMDVIENVSSVEDLDKCYEYCEAERRFKENLSNVEDCYRQAKSLALCIEE